MVDNAVLRLRPTKPSPAIPESNGGKGDRNRVGYTCNLIFAEVLMVVLVSQGINRMPCFFVQHQKPHALPAFD